MVWPVNARTSAMLDEVQALCGFTITATQGSPNIGVGASAGTHDGEGVVDVVGADLDLIVYYARMVGFAGWHRTVAEGFTPHDHLVAVGEPDLSSAAADQVTDYIEGRNGLATNAPDDGPRDFVGQTWEGYLAGNPPAGGSPVFRGVQLGISGIVVTAGPLDPFGDIYPGIVDRDDATTVTLTVGDEFYIYLDSGQFSSTDVFSMENWRLNAAGHGTLALAESYDPDYLGVPDPWNALGDVVIDTDTLALTATPALTHTPTILNGDDGAVLFRVTCTAGSVDLDWLCLQVEPPAGLLIESGSHWSPWHAPQLVPHTPDAVGSRLNYGWAYTGGSGWDETQMQDALDLVQDGALLDYHTKTDWNEVPVTPAGNPIGLIADSSARGFVGSDFSTFAQPEYVEYTATPGVGGLAATFALKCDDAKAYWGSWPTYQITPPELNSTLLSGEVVRSGGLPVFEMEAGDTVSTRWRPTYITIFYNDGDDVRDDGAFGTAQATPGVALVGQTGVGALTPSYTSPVFTPTSPGADITLEATNDYMFGAGFGPPDDAAGPTWTDHPNAAASRAWIAGMDAAVDLQMPDFRYLVKDWTRSPDALDTSPPEGVIVTWLRQRQRNDGLGNSVIRAKGASSRQRSLRQRGYR